MRTTGIYVGLCRNAVAGPRTSQFTKRNFYPIFLSEDLHLSRSLGSFPGHLGSPAGTGSIFRLVELTQMANFPVKAMIAWPFAITLPAR